MNLKKIYSKIFLQHPHSIGESYLQHFHFAFRNGFSLLGAGMACLIHSVFPILFPSTASTIVEKFNQEMSLRKTKPPLADDLEDLSN